MKLVLLCAGKLRHAALRQLCLEYTARLQRYGPCEVREVRAADGLAPGAAREDESARLAAALPSSGTVWVLDERGQELDSPAWARRLEHYENRAVKQLVLVLGGAQGCSATLLSRGERMALSRLTFPHELCRAIVLEQLYRARTIQRGEPYHHA